MCWAPLGKAGEGQHLSFFSLPGFSSSSFHGWCLSMPCGRDSIGLPPSSSEAAGACFLTKKQKKSRSSPLGVLKDAVPTYATLRRDPSPHAAARMASRLPPRPAMRPASSILSTCFCYRPQRPCFRMIGGYQSSNGACNLRLRLNVTFTGCRQIYLWATGSWPAHDCWPNVVGDYVRRLAPHLSDRKPARSC